MENKNDDEKTIKITFRELDAKRMISIFSENKSRDIKILDIHSNNFKKEKNNNSVSRVIKEYLEKNSSVEKVILDRNHMLGDDGVQEICKAFYRNDKVKYVSLWNNNIGEQGFQAIYDCLLVNTTLRGVSLSFNYIDVKWGQKFKTLLENHPSLCALDPIGYNIKNYVWDRKKHLSRPVFYFLFSLEEEQQHKQKNEKKWGKKKDEMVHDATKQIFFRLSINNFYYSFF